MPANLENSAVATGLEKVRSIFILIPKQGNAKECSNYLTIALISHASMEKAMATHSSTLSWKLPWMEVLVGCHLWGLTESDMTEAT